MSVESVMGRIAEIDRSLVPPAASPASTSSFQATLGAQTAAVAGANATPAMTTTDFSPTLGGGRGSGGGAQGMRQAASAEVGQPEQPPGSTVSPRIAVSRSATAGSGVGPWC